MLPRRGDPQRRSAQSQPLPGRGHLLLFQHRPGWPAGAAVGKTLVSSSMIDRVCAKAWTRTGGSAGGLQVVCRRPADGALGFGGEESAGASFLRRDGTVWTTDKDGIIMGLLAAEILARTGKDPGHYRELTEKFGAPVYERIDAPATPEQKAILSKLSPSDLHASEFAGEKIEATLTTAPGNGEPIGGLKGSDGQRLVRRPPVRHGKRV